MLNQSNANLVKTLNQMINKYGTNRQVKEYLKTKEVDLKLIQGIEVNTLYKDYEVHIYKLEENENDGTTESNDNTNS